MLGGWLGSKLESVVRQWLGYNESEDRKKAMVIVEAMLYLETPNLEGLDKSVVNRSFRKKAINYHPDKQINKSEQEVKEARIQWDLLCYAKTLLGGYLDHAHTFSDACRKFIVDTYNEQFPKLSTLEFKLLKLDQKEKAAQQSIKVQERKKIQ